jgi:hypothetical protein
MFNFKNLKASVYLLAIGVAGAEGGGGVSPVMLSVTVVQLLQ